MNPAAMASYRNLMFMELRRSMRLVEEHWDYLLGLVAWRLGLV